MPADPRTVDVRVAIPIPAGLEAPSDAGALSAQLRLLWLVDQVRQRQLGIGKGAEWAGVSRAEFMGILGSHGVPVIAYDVDDFEREIRALGIE